MSGEEAKALVVRTGFDTTKGLLVKSILYPKPTKFKFHADSLKFIFSMGIFAVIGFLITLPKQLELGVLETSEIIMKFIDLLSIVIPPMLPAAMTVGIVVSIGRLKTSQIFCIAPQRINVAGRVSIMVFDKTGTLTEEGLEVSGFRTIFKNKANLH